MPDFFDEDRKRVDELQTRITEMIHGRELVSSGPFYLLVSEEGGNVTASLCTHHVRGIDVESTLAMLEKALERDFGGESEPEVGSDIVRH